MSNLNQAGATLFLLVILQACTWGAPPSVGPTRDYSAPGSCKCGVTQVKAPRVMGGQPAKKNEFPWLVAIFLNGQFLCGGSLLSSQTVLTAAHCLHEFRHGVIENSQIKVHVGEHDVSRVDGEEKIEVFGFTLHPLNNIWTGYNDFAIIQLDRGG